MSTKGLTKDLINKFKVLNGTKYFSSGIFQNYLVFIPAKKYIKYLNLQLHKLSLLELILRNVGKWQKKILKV